MAIKVKDFWWLTKVKGEACGVVLFSPLDVTVVRNHRCTVIPQMFTWSHIIFLIFTSVFWMIYLHFSASIWERYKLERTALQSHAEITQDLYKKITCLTWPANVAQATCVTLTDIKTYYPGACVESRHWAWYHCGGGHGDALFDKRAHTLHFTAVM